MAGVEKVKSFFAFSNDTNYFFCEPFLVIITNSCTETLQKVYNKLIYLEYMNRKKFNAMKLNYIELKAIVHKTYKIDRQPFRYQPDHECVEHAH